MKIRINISFMFTFEGLETIKKIINELKLELFHMIND